ncbi:hypothetical protein AGMMS49957_02920 [Synergistales bacterium]|nr:hypothetical protein AGMMS49957_02920 [Synergistales bacterium]
MIVYNHTKKQVKNYEESDYLKDGSKARPIAQELGAYDSGKHRRTHYEWRLEARRATYGTRYVRFARCQQVSVEGGVSYP